MSEIIVKEALSEVKNFVNIAESIEEANERLNFYCLYNNTMEKVEMDAARNLQRKHPVRYVETHLDYNSLFDELQSSSGKGPKETVSL